jgi:multiple sugar transport system permease protein
MSLRSIPKSGFQKKYYLFCYLGLLPILLLYLFLRVIPLIQALGLSFYNWNMINAYKPFVGLANYFKLVHDSVFQIAIKNTLIFAFFSVTIGIILALGLAVILNRSNMKSAGIYQVIYFLPVITPMVPVAIIWKWIYDPGYGLLNYIISFFGVKPIGWLMYPKLALAAITVMCIWKALGYNMIMFLVGLKAISKQYYEAAVIDGANKWHSFIYITVPLLKPIFLYVLVTASIDAFNMFTPVYIMTGGAQGASGNMVRTLVYNIYEDGFRYFKMGYASSQAVVLLFIVLAVTAVQFGVLRNDNSGSDNQ